MLRAARLVPPLVSLDVLPADVPAQYAPAMVAACTEALAEGTQKQTLGRFVASVPQRMLHRRRVAFVIEDIALDAADIASSSSSGSVPELSC